MDLDDHQTRWAPDYAPAALEDLRVGGKLLRKAFLDMPALSATREAVIIGADTRQPPALMIERGVAYRSVALPDGRRSIIDMLLPRDVIGLHHAVLGRCDYEIVAANDVSYRLLPPAKVHELMRDPRVALRALALSAESKWRLDRHLTQVTRADARGRLAAMILGVYERLRRRNLIARPTFNLPLTQEQIADHIGMTIVHVSRTLRRLREEGIVLVERQLVIILDLDELRRAALAGPSFRPAVASGMEDQNNNASLARRDR